MESVVVKDKGRKRKRKDGEDEDGNTRRKIVLGLRCVGLVGRYVKKEFEGSGEFLGKIVSYDSGLYRVVYEDGDFEDLEAGEAKGILVGENETDGSLSKRKKLLDEYILKKQGKKKAVKSNASAKKVETVENDNGVLKKGKKEAVKSKAGAKKAKTVGNDNGAKSVVDNKVDNEVDNADKMVVDDKVESSAVSEAKDEVDVDSESSSDLSDYEPCADVAEVERPWVPPPQLPVSSGNLGVPEDDVANLLSVYSFLRSFSVCLFLSPFGLDEFVGALNCSVHNTLLDAIHVALIRALKSHVEILQSEGSELASKCLRIIDWSLLDSLTWPVFIVQYLTTMRYTEKQEWKEFYSNVWEKDYYTLSAGRKLAVLQLLCDDASNSAEIRTEIDNREESELGPDPDRVTVKKASDDDNDDDGNGDECRLCGMDGTLICCDGCPSSYHSRCIGMMKLSIPEGEWYCPECTVNRIGPIVTKKTSLRGAEFFGVDPYEQVFLGSCDHLLVMKAFASSGSHIRYYSSVDIQNVLHVLTCSAEYASLYMEICKGILQYWEISENVFSLSHSVGIDDKSGIINAQDVVIAAENANGVAEKCEELGFGQDSLNESNIKSMCDLSKLSSENKEVELGFGQDSLNESNIKSMCDLPKSPFENKEVELGFGQDSLNESGQDSLNESNINNVCDLPKLPFENKEVEPGFGHDSLNESNINNVCDLPKSPFENKEAELHDSLNESNINNLCELPKSPVENKEVELGFGHDSLNESNINGVCDLPELPSVKKEVELGFGQDTSIENNINGICDLPKLPSVDEKVELGFGQDSLNESNINGVCDLPKLTSENKEVELGFGQDTLNESNINSVRDLPKLPFVNKEVELGFGQDSLNESNINSVCDLPKLPSENKEVRLYTGLSFKPNAYFNVYIHGDFAASAGASLSTLSSEEKPGTQTQSLRISQRKLMSANLSLQAKAFSLAAKRFYWPNYEKKLAEVCRERCGWCLSCKAVVNSKRGCLLNAAASNAIKGAAKILSSLRQSKNVESSLASIATYVMFMEESLYGLISGPFLNSSYRNQWQKHVEEAASLGEIKAYLLEFERNIRDIAFSTDWVRLVDDTGSESQLGQTAKNVTGSTQKRGFGRRGKKAAVIIPEIPDTDVKDLSTDLAWWRGGMLSKHIFQKGVLPQMMIKHAARQGGCGKISGVQYVDGLEVPKRSRQFIWRAAVDMSKTASQLALQVRYLDLHVRWNELVCPEQTPQEGKGLEAETYAFRNACIIDKKTLGNKVSYGVIFENQKHLPSRVLKRILEVEETGDKRSKNWFLGTHIPLYLIKEYEVATVAGVKNSSLISDVKHVSRSTKFSKKQLNCSGKNIFSFLEQKRDDMGCTYCQHDVSFRMAARCNACQGYCHEQCAVGTNIHTTARVEFIITCKRCYIEKEGARKNEIVGDSPTSPLLLQGKESQRPATVIKIKLGKQNGLERPLECSNVRSSQPQKSKSGKKNSKNRVDQKPKNSKSKTGLKKKTGKNNNCLGLIWKKKNADDTGVEFRINNILLKGNPNGHLLAPKCYLCAQPYNSDLMYILCEKCVNWFHADSVGLQESKIMELYGFKCSRCRRIRTPICPYMDPETRSKLESKKPVARNQKIKNSEPESEINSDSYSDFDFVSETNDELINDWELDSIPDFDANVHEEYEQEQEHEQEHPFYSFPPVDFDQVNDDKSEPGPKKLPVRRHTKPERDSNPGVDISSPNPDPIESTPIVEWDVSANGFADDMMFDYGNFNYEDMEFEPQTYFSFNELLASDEGDKVGPNPDPAPQVTEPAPAPGDCNPDQYQMGITYDEQEPMFSVESGLDMVPCRVCSQADPCPDLFCQTCGLWLHQHCSPWEEDSSWEPETGWKCGNCRQWS